MSRFASVKANLKWVSNSNAGNFKSKVNESNENIIHYSDFCHLRRYTLATGLCGSWDGDIPQSLPDAQPQ